MFQFNRSLRASGFVYVVVLGYIFHVISMAILFFDIHLQTEKLLPIFNYEVWPMMWPFSPVYHTHFFYKKKIWVGNLYGFDETILMIRDLVLKWITTSHLKELKGVAWYSFKVKHFEFSSYPSSPKPFPRIGRRPCISSSEGDLQDMLAICA